MHSTGPVVIRTEEEAMRHDALQEPVILQNQITHHCVEERVLQGFMYGDPFLWIDD